MKTSLTKIISSIAVITGLAVGAFALSVMANYSEPIHSPPQCNSGDPGCDAPLNVGPGWQSKSGSIQFSTANGPCQTDASGNCIKMYVEGAGLFSGDLGISGITKTFGGLVIQTCASGSCPGDGSNPVETGQMWLVK